MDRIEYQIISFLSKGTASPWEIIANIDASLPEFYKKLNKLKGEDIIEINDGKLKLTQKGKKFAEKWIDLKCNACDGTGYKFFCGIEKEYKKIMKERPPAFEKYDQGYMGVGDVLRRISFIYERGDLKGKIFVIGDDDFLSIACGLTFIPKKVVAIDIDERIVEFINRIANEYSLSVEAFIQDIRKENIEFFKKFDVFVTDPVETLPGIKLFLSRGAYSLKRNGAGYFGLTTLEASMKKWYEIQKMLHEMGFVITDIRRKFNTYPAEKKNFSSYQNKLPIFKKLKLRMDCNWYKSSLYRIEAVKNIKPLIKGDVNLGKELYIDDESWATPR
ncbi:MAG: bis-aminopropyl spermidine synthase family protein [Thermoplasmatales archaeon]|nr:bis-aminopropyl spermidine synthase family protein [Thermoplasmatales archaeon]